VVILTQVKVTFVSEQKVSIQAADGEKLLGPFDTVILATGATPVNDLKKLPRY